MDVEDDTRAAVVLSDHSRAFKNVSEAKEERPESECSAVKGLPREVPKNRVVWAKSSSCVRKKKLLAMTSLITQQLPPE